MGTQYELPPDPNRIELKRIYPWDEYNLTLIMKQLYKQAQKTGFVGTFEDFRLRYGTMETILYTEVQNETGGYTAIISARG